MTDRERAKLAVSAVAAIYAATGDYNRSIENDQYTPRVATDHVIQVYCAMLESQSSDIK
jgi:hypothetical protein